MQEYIEIECAFCKKKFQRYVKRHKRSIKLSKLEYCSTSCSSVNNNRDEFSEFRVYFRSINSRIKKTANKNATHTDLTLPYLKELWEKQKGICPYSGIKLEHRKFVATNSIYTASLDRIDSSKSYLMGNVQFVSRALNYMKCELTHEETMGLCKIIANYHNTGNIKVDYSAIEVSNSMLEN